MTMAPPSLANMPTEVLITVFKYSSNLSAACALSQVSPSIRNDWTANIPDICDAILPRIIECYEQANELFQAQEMIAPVKDALQSRLKAVLKSQRRHQPEIMYLLRVPTTTKVAIEKTRRMLSNARTMEGVLDRFDISEKSSTSAYNLELEPRLLTAAERERFIKAYYRATYFATLAQEPASKMLLLTLNRFEVFQLSDVMYFLNFSKTPRPMLKVANTFSQDEPRHPGQRSNRNWSRAGSIVRRLHCDLMKLPMNREFHTEDHWLEPRYPFIREGGWELAEEDRGTPIGEYMTIN